MSLENAPIKTCTAKNNNSAVPGTLIVHVPEGIYPYATQCFGSGSIESGSRSRVLIENNLQLNK
jgi:hypothetical protein